MWPNLRVRILSSKQIAKFKGRNGMQKKRMQNKIIQINLNVKITLNVNRHNQEKYNNITFVLNALLEKRIIFV